MIDSSYSVSSNEYVEGVACARRLHWQPAMHGQHVLLQRQWKTAKKAGKRLQIASRSDQPFSGPYKPSSKRSFVGLAWYSRELKFYKVCHGFFFNFPDFF